jgi:hypothetical protein
MPGGLVQNTMHSMQLHAWDGWDTFMDSAPSRDEAVIGA